MLDTKNTRLFAPEDFPSWPQWGPEEERAILDALEAGEWGTLGSRAMEFADAFGKYLGRRRVIPVNTGTQALELLLRACGVGRGDEVIVPPYTFVATVSAVAWVGAMPVFADVDADTGCLDPESVRRAVTPRTKAILAVHVAGRPCDMDALSLIAREKGVYLLEDAAHAHGSAWKGKRAGALADAAAFSFQSSKMLTGGEGGAIATDDEAIFARAWQYHNSGRALQGGGMLGGEVLMGTNGRMAEWEAAILLKQLERLEGQCAARSAGAAILDEVLGSVPGLRLAPRDERVTAWSGFLYQFRYVGEGSRDAFVSRLRAMGLPCSAGYPVLYGMGMFRDESFERSTGERFGAVPDCPNAAELAKSAVWMKGQALMASPDVLRRAARTIADAAEETGA